LPASLLESLGLPTEVPLPLPVVPELLPLEPDEDPLPVPMLPLPLDDPEPLVPLPMLLSAPPVLPALLPPSMPLELPPYWLLELGLELLPLEVPLWAIAAPLATQVASPRAAVTIANFLFAMLSLIAIVECLR
jgi:hypothetical protein